jgi:hypothetical protein
MCGLVLRLMSFWFCCGKKKNNNCYFILDWGWEASPPRMRFLDLSILAVACQWPSTWTLSPALSPSTLQLDPRLDDFLSHPEERSTTEEGLRNHSATDPPPIIQIQIQGNQLSTRTDDDALLTNRLSSLPRDQNLKSWTPKFVSSQILIVPVHTIYVLSMLLLQRVVLWQKKNSLVQIQNTLLELDTWAGIEMR